MELCYAPLARDAPTMEYKRQGKRKKYHDFFVLINELT
jgi:hypothetical protein